MIPEAPGEECQTSSTARPARTSQPYGDKAKQRIGAMPCLALLASLMLTACTKEPPAHWLSDTKIPFVDFGLVWMDNERLLFQRMEQVAMATRSNPMGTFDHPLSTWSRDDGLNTLTRTKISKPCFARETGTFSYRIVKDAENGPTFRIGKPDAMVDKSLKAEAADRAFNPFTCSFQSQPSELSGHTVVPLRPGHGIVDLGRPNSADKAHLLADDGQSVNLPFTQAIVSPKGISADGEGYLVVADAQRNASCRRVWRLIPGQGASEEACLPEMSSSRVVRTALGWALDKREYECGTDIGDSGIFLITADGDLVKLAWGFVENLAVSPDGCRLAFGHAPDLKTSCLDGSFRRKTVKYIDLCALKAEILAQ